MQPGHAIDMCLLYGISYTYQVFHMYVFMEVYDNVYQDNWYHHHVDKYIEPQALNSVHLFLENCISSFIW